MSAEGNDAGGDLDMPGSLPCQVGVMRAARGALRDHHAGSDRMVGGFLGTRRNGSTHKAVYLDRA